MPRPAYAPRGALKAKPSDPIAPPDPKTARPRCTARGKTTKKPCSQPAILGGTVCRYHGGAAPQVRKKALDRLMEYQDRAISRLFSLAEQEAFPSTAYAATRDILDRTMGKPAESVAVEHSGDLTIRWQGD